MRWTHAAGLALLLAAATACAMLGAGRPGHRDAPVAHSGTKSESVANGPATGPDVPRTLRAGTVRLDLPGGGHGSGFCRRLSDGSVWVWTCAHVAVHAQTKQGWLPLRVTSRAFGADDVATGSSVSSAAVVRVSGDTDVALLVVSGPFAAPGTLDFSPAAPLLSNVWACGCPGGFDFTLTRGVLNFRGRATPYGELDQTDLPSLGGSSGGPVVGDDGRVVGIVNGGIGEAFTCIVPARHIRTFAASEGLLFAYEGTEPPGRRPATMAALSAPAIPSAAP